MHEERSASFVELFFDLVFVLPLALPMMSQPGRISAA